ncbi:MAG: hypothetical protein VB106_00395 [Clostridiaceae bacterium]|jgi:hypothetical protein|nr:hypothetical protein [Clostridiaceae bacterium]
MAYNRQMSNILQMSDYELAYEQLSRDLLFYKIPSEQVEYYVNTAMDIGAEAAEQYQSKDICELCTENGVFIEISNRSGKFLGTRMRAEIHMKDDENKIILYQQSIDDIAKAVLDCLPCEQQLSEDKIRKMHIAHEFFHFIEHRNDCCVNEMLPKVVIFRILGLQRKASILTLSEVAAHSFSKRLLALPHYPYLYDKLYALFL